MDESFNFFMNYNSVSLNTEIAGIYCIYKVLESYFKNITRFIIDFEVEVEEEVEEEDEEELDFEFEYFGV